MYLIQSTNTGSDRLGECEVCGKKCSEVFKLKSIAKPGFGILKFGHESCLKEHAKTNF